jgi:hypothetical protein
LLACQLIEASRRTCRTVSVLTTIRCAPAKCSTSLDRLHVVNGKPNCCGAVVATRQTISRATNPNLRGRPPLHFGSNAANPCSLNAWITSRAYCAVAANIAAASAGLWPCTEASTIPVRRNRTRSRAVRLDAALVSGLLDRLRQRPSIRTARSTRVLDRRASATTAGRSPPLARIAGWIPRANSRNSSTTSVSSAVS